MEGPSRYLILLIGVLATYLAYLVANKSTDKPSWEHCNRNVSQPQSNAPLNHDLVYYKLEGFNGPRKELNHNFIMTDCGANLSVHYTDPLVWAHETGTAGRPILVLTHGYPESSYIWRDVIPKISRRVPVFVPDQPGYGLSSPCCKSDGSNCAYDKRTYAKAIMQAARAIYGNVHVVYAGHDRGARTMHRAAVDNDFPGITGIGAFLADIVPNVAEYDSFSNPLYAAGYFHWAFLPKGEFALDVIMAYGGGAWTKQLLTYGSGKNVKATQLFKAGHAWEIYENFFDQLSVTNASVFDYVAGATVDYQEQVWDQGNNTKIKLPTHILYSIYNLGAQFDVHKIWTDYVAPGVKLTVEGIGGERGHFIIEEAPDETVAQLNEFLDSIGVTA